jgi:TolB protein
MTTIIQKYKSTVALAGIALAALALGACGTTGDIDVSGFAGGPTETASPASAATEEILFIPPTATPIPPASGHILFTANRGGQSDLFMTKPDGLEVTRLTTNAGVDESAAPQISPDGTKVAFVATLADNTDIYLLDLASLNIRRITDAQGRDSAPSWSPDGQRLAFESFRDGNLEIYLVNADGSNLTRLTNDPAGDSNPAWSPISNDILFVSNRFGNSDLFLLSPNGAVSTLTTNPAPDNAPAWSPDGNFIAFLSYSGELSNLCIITRTDLTQGCFPTTAKFIAPVWSPDSNRVAANASINGSSSIQIVNILDGSAVQLSQPGIEPRGNPAWSADGLRLAFQAQTGGDMELFYALIQANEFIRITAANGYDGEPVWVSQ